MTRPRLLDLFCGAGGAAMGYHRAGFDVTGVDIRPQPRYPFDFIQADAMTFPLEGWDAIHASPPCQAFSVAAKYRGVAERHADLLTPSRYRLLSKQLPWVIENVPGSPMRADFKLCGCVVGLNELERERWFETNWLDTLDMRPPCCRVLQPVTVAGHGPRVPMKRKRFISVVGGGPDYRTRHRSFTVADWRRAMGIDWMTRDELAQAIPPAYTEYIGRQLLDHLERAA